MQSSKWDNIGQQGGGLPLCVLLLLIIIITIIINSYLGVATQAVQVKLFEREWRPHVSWQKLYLIVADKITVIKLD